VRCWLTCSAALLAFTGALYVARPAGAQQAPPLITDDRAEAMLRSLPTIPFDEVAGLRQFTRVKFDAGHLSWTMLAVSGALFLMAPGLILFYGGQSHNANAAALLVEFLLFMALMSLAWTLWIYSLAFSRHEHSFDTIEAEIQEIEEGRQPGSRFLGGTSHIALQGLDPQLKDSTSAYPMRRPTDAIPHLLFMLLQLGVMIAGTAPLVAVLAPRFTLAGRMLFGLLWGTLVYAPIAYWIWGGGWHAAALDFAGGIVLHVSLGFSALGLAFLLSRAAVNPDQSAPSEKPNLAWLGIGTALFWGGSLLCNGSHALAANAQSMSACVATHLSACTGILGWAGCEWLARGKASPAGICSGAMAGLFAIAPACGYVAPQSALLIGLAAGVICRLAFGFCCKRWPANSFLTPFVLQGVGGALGVLLTGIFATGGIAGFNRRGDEIHGLLSGNSYQLVVQAAALAATAALAVIGTLLIAAVVRLVARPAAHVEEPAASA
jgi:Amt family ammonium transporter